MSGVLFKRDQGQGTRASPPYLWLFGLFHSDICEWLTHTDPGGTKGQTEPDAQFSSLTEVEMSVRRFCQLSGHSDPLIQAFYPNRLQAAGDAVHLMLASERW